MTDASEVGGLYGYGIYVTAGLADVGVFAALSASFLVLDISVPGSSEFQAAETSQSTLPSIQHVQNSGVIAAQHPLR